MKRPESTVNDGSGSSGEAKYRGVRPRKWGTWVLEVRLPNSRERIWLGSYDSPKKAAQAFNAAAFCLHGVRAQLNFPDDPPDIPSRAPQLTHQQIQEVAARHANTVPSCAPAPETSSAARADTASLVPTPETGSVAESIEAMVLPFLDLVPPSPWYCGYDFIPEAEDKPQDTAEDRGSSSPLEHLKDFQMIAT